MYLIATWTTKQDVETDNPSKITWEDGSPATLEDFQRMSDEGSQSDPDFDYLPNGELKTVSYGYHPRTK